MAYMSQERKAVITGELAKVMPKGWKYTLAVEHHTTLICTIRSAPVDLLAKINEALAPEHHEDEYARVNHYQISRVFSDPEMVAIFQRIADALNCGNHDRSDSASDYFDVGWYVEIKIGAGRKPFVFKP